MKNKQWMFNRKADEESGFALIIVVILSWMLFAFSLSFFDLVQTEKRIVHINESKMMANNIAEAAMEDLMWEYNYGGADFDAGSGWTTSGSDKVKTVGSFTNTSGTAVGSYTITVANYSAATPTITIVGTNSLFNTSNQTTFKGALQSRSPFTAGVSVQGAIDMDSNSDIDSYNSTTGSYGGGNVGSNGDVVTLGTTANIITTGSHAEIKGDVTMGSGGTIDDSSVVTGTVTSGGASGTFTAVSVPSALSSLSSSGTISNTTTLSAGSYKYTSINMSSNKNLTISGNVTLYVTGTLTMNSNADIVLNSGATLTIYAGGNVDFDSNVDVNYTSSAQNSSNLILYGTSGCTSINLDSNVNVAGLIYAPSAHLNMDSNTNLYGSAIANTLDIGSGGAIHYDESCTSASTVMGSGKKMLWFRQTS